MDRCISFFFLSSQVDQTHQEKRAVPTESDGGQKQETEHDCSRVLPFSSGRKDMEHPAFLCQGRQEIADTGRAQAVTSQDAVLKYLRKDWAWPNVVTRACNPNYLEDRGSRFNAILGKKLSRPHLTNKPGVVPHLCNPSYMRGTGRMI
jgi:hypothetical protein